MTYSKFYTEKTKKSQWLRRDVVGVDQLIDIIDKIKNPLTETFSDSFSTWHASSPEQNYLPIEFFRPDIKKNKHQLFQGNRVFKKFESSGTTRSKRATSFFSKEGFLLYQIAAIKTFRSLLEIFFGEIDDNVEGFSFIPSLKEWPQSSLAQMISWFQDTSSLTYISSENFTAAFSRKNLQELGNKPCFLFGTAAHFLNLIKKGSHLNLPKNIILIETGGFKGLHEDLERKNYYRKLASFFQLSEKKIVSEYSMAELSCQAYDWYDDKLKHRSGFRFPSWVSVSVVDGLDVRKKEGLGALTIFDPLRIDYPWPIRTQDIVELKTDRAFSLLERVPGAVLKGCSISVKDVIRQRPSTSINWSKKRKKRVFKKYKISQSSIQRRIKKFVPKFTRFLNSQSAVDSLKAELISRSAAKAALKDLLNSLPNNKEAWLLAIKNSFEVFEEKGHLMSASPRCWLFIPPSNHSLASLRTLIMAYLVGFRVFIRLPKFGIKKMSFLEEVICFLQKFSDAHMRTLQNCFRIGADRVPVGVESVLCYGDTSTINAIKIMTSLPVKGFGTHLTISLMQMDSIERESLPVVKDAFSLGQRGCMSSRLGIVVCEHHEHLNRIFSKKIENSLKRAFRKFWNNDLTDHELLSLNHEEIIFKEKDVKYFRRETRRDPLFPIYFVYDKKQISRPFFESILSSRPFVFPLIVLDKKALPSYLKLISSISDVKKVAVCETL